MFVQQSTPFAQPRRAQSVVFAYLSIAFAVLLLAAVMVASRYALPVSRELLDLLAPYLGHVQAHANSHLLACSAMPIPCMPASGLQG